MKKTITSIFIVPTLKIPKNALKDNGFINGYINDEMNDIQYKDCVFLLFRPEFPCRFRTFLNNEYKRTSAIVNDYDFRNGFCVVVYKMDSGFALDFELIKQGKYSKTSHEFQNLFPKTVNLVLDGESREELSLQYRVFNRTPDLLNFWKKKNPLFFKDDQELWFGFDEEKETLTQGTLKELIWNKFQAIELYF